MKAIMLATYMVNACRIAKLNIIMNIRLMHTKGTRLATGNDSNDVALLIIKNIKQTDSIATKMMGRAVLFEDITLLIFNCLHCSMPFPKVILCY